jgi:photosystem II stability/assembly factor-like uncharacterized protein
MEWTLAFGTSDGVVLARQAGDDLEVVDRCLPGRTVTALTTCGTALLAGTLDGVLRSDDGGATWQDASTGLAVRHVRWLASSPGGDPVAYVGTEPAAIHRLACGGHPADTNGPADKEHPAGAGHWRECPEVARLRDAHGWWLPYSREDGCVRGFAADGTSAHGTSAHMYAAVEVGGVLRSDDGGQTWALVAGNGSDPRNLRPPAPLVHPDVHSISVHPSSPDAVTAPTGGGLYRTSDGGATWTNLYRCYCRAAWVDPEDAAHIVFGPADGVSRNGRIEETTDGGVTWRPASEGQDVPWARHMVERFTQFGDTLLAVLSNGHLLAAERERLAWRRVLPAVEGTRCAIVR